METIWNVLTLCTGLSFLELCNGLPINVENSLAGDTHTQFLTGLVAILLTVCSIVFFVACVCCQRRSGFKVFRDSPVIIAAATGADPGHINPIANGEFTIFTPLGPSNLNNNVFQENQQQQENVNDDNFHSNANVRSWFDGSEKDFPRARLKYIRELGKGWFGRVVEGAALGVTAEDGAWTPVAVRILEATASTREKLVFLHDASVYRCGGHPNVLQLLGRCLDTVPFLLLQEFCPRGDLKRYLRENQSSYEKLLSGEYPLLWCCQLTSAVKHLHESNVVHPDLAARNCLLSQDLQLKLGDYGLGVSSYPEDYYQGAPGVPLRWCAPESLIYTMTTIQPRQVSLEGNVWALGVTMWEIYQCGELPYSNLTDDEVIAQVLGPSKLKLGRPTYTSIYTDYMFRLMLLCWSTPESRPAISQLDLMLTDLLRVHRNRRESRDDAEVSLDDFDRRWDTFKPNDIVKTDNEADSDASTPQQTLADKEMSPSLNNLLEESSEGVEMGEVSRAIRELDHALEQENVSSSESSHPSLELRPRKALQFELAQPDSLTHRSSSSETEDENWRRKIERGAYSEKVRQKSRSVADLMILTHIDCSESDSETPLPSLDYTRSNYRNVRFAPKQNNLESASLLFGSEGNLLNVQETFQEELRRLQEERRDSLLFVPEKISQVDLDISSSCSSVSREQNSSGTPDSVLSSPAKKILEELNSPVEMQPVNQVFNVYSVTIDPRFSPVHTFIPRNGFRELEPRKFQVPKLVDIIQNNMELLDYIIQQYESENISETLVTPEKFDSLSSEDEDKPQLTVVECASQILSGILEEAAARVDDMRVTVSSTADFLDNEKLAYDSPPRKIDFDVSAEQELNSGLFCSTPNVRKLFPSHLLVEHENEEEMLQFSSNFTDEEGTNLGYCLETWDNFLGQTLESQENDEQCFSSFNSEPEETQTDRTFIVNDEEKASVEAENETYVVDGEGSVEEGSWEAGGGWYLHPQSEEMSGEMSVEQSGDEESYVGFGMDDEIMAAIRNELLEKLPHAQSASSSDRIEENEEWETEDRNEVFLKYNVYNPPLSPILEETFSESDSKPSTPREINTDEEEEEEEEEEANWSGPENANHETTFESAIQDGPHFGHTTSQESCCSNDTLFNLEELAITEPENKTHDDSHILEDSENVQSDSMNMVVQSADRCAVVGDGDEREDNGPVDSMGKNYEYVREFLRKEQEDVYYTESEEPTLTENSPLRSAVPLPSPEDVPWKQLPASLLTYEKVVTSKGELIEDLKGNGFAEDEAPKFDDINEADFVNINNLENSWSSQEFPSEVVLGEDGECADTLCVLGDIRFTGPCESQLMSTSFSESNELGDEQGWDSGSDTRSSSSGEFIWKEGEHEESVRALHASDDLNNEKSTHLEEVREEGSESSGSDEECDSPEFVPSAWDKYAIPVKSALRSPEKTLEQPEKEKKSKGVWFKKQKYHCIYEYPREPESPVLHSFDLWKQTPDYNSLDWELDGDPFLPPPYEDDANNLKKLDFYNYRTPADYSGGTLDDFFISGSSRPFNSLEGLSSQFFPGELANRMGCGENVTPDSGVEDVTPDYVPKPVQSLKVLSAAAAKKNSASVNDSTSETKSRDVLGGLRHTRNKLKLDLPPSPSAFTSAKAFTMDPPETITAREVPSFTTFGKSRFLVQQVDTPEVDEQSATKNVSFEALPHKPIKTEFGGRKKCKVETVRGEASLLDSADEDSGIESSTLERGGKVVE